MDNSLSKTFLHILTTTRRLLAEKPRPLCLYLENKNELTYDNDMTTVSQILYRESWDLNLFSVLPCMPYIMDRLRLGPGNKSKLAGQFWLLNLLFVPVSKSTTTKNNFSKLYASIPGGPTAINLLTSFWCGLKGIVHNMYTVSQSPKAGCTVISVVFFNCRRDKAGNLFLNFICQDSLNAYHCQQKYSVMLDLLHCPW